MKSKYLFSLTFILALGFQMLAQAQSPYVKKVPKHSFINYDTNKILYYGDSTSLDRFYEKLQESLVSKESNVNIMHVGGSHIQADIWSGTTRINMQTMEPHMKGERGMVFPLHMARSNNPNNFKTEYTGTWEKCRSAQKLDDCPVGLLGYQVRTTDTLTTFKIYCYDEYYPLKYKSDKIKLYYDIEDESYTPFIIDGGIKKKMNFYNFLGYAYYEFESLQDTIYFEVRKTDSIQNYFELYGIQLENDDPGLIYQNIGCNGADVPSYNNSLWLEQHLHSMDVDLVIFSIGINDAYDSSFRPKTYKQNYDTLIGLFRRVYPDVDILLTTNNDSYRNGKPNPRAIEVREVMQQLCVDHNAAIWDMFEIMGGLGSIKTWEDHGLAKKDKIHFSNKGYRLVGDMMFNALMNDYQNFLKDESN
ncbi:MAG: hypothetical protein HRT72_06730 [Flavobacteriales bacterium]|nr:hypothetical protein [Flavobacteriales bacterium]